MKCKNCNEGIVFRVYVEFVSHDMALDSGYPEMEGEIFGKIEDYEICECCGGNYENCEFCTEHEKDF